MAKRANSRPPSQLVAGEVVEASGRRFRVTESDIEAVMRMRLFLIEEAGDRATITYGELVRALRLPCAPKGLGRLLVLLSEDCNRRGEPTLASIVVTQSTGEVGRGYGQGAAIDRQELFDHWASRGRQGE